MTPGPTLIQLRAFVAAAEAGSFGRAATALGLAPSSVSEGVQALEQLGGEPLFRRSPRGIALTPAGERALPHARLTVQHSEDFALALNGSGAALAGTLRVAAYRSLGVHLLPPVLSLLRRHHPDLRVQILDGTSGEGGEHLIEDGQADVAFTERTARTSLLTLPVVEDQHVLVLPRRRLSRPLVWTDLRAQPLLLFPAHHACNAELHRHLATFLTPGTVVEEVAEDEVMLSMVEHGLGWAVLPHLAVVPLRQGLMTQPLPAPLSRTLGMAIQPGRAGLPHIRAFVDALRLYRTTPEFARLQKLLVEERSFRP